MLHLTQNSVGNHNSTLETTSVAWWVCLIIIKPVYCNTGRAPVRQATHSPSFWTLHTNRVVGCSTLRTNSWPTWWHMHIYRLYQNPCDDSCQEFPLRKRKSRIVWQYTRWVTFKTEKLHLVSNLLVQWLIESRSHLWRPPYQHLASSSSSGWPLSCVHLELC